MELRSLRKKAGLRAEEVAQKLGIPPRTYRYWEKKGIPKATPQQMKILCNLFQVSLEDWPERKEEVGI